MTGAFATLPGAARAAVPQHHAGALLRAATTPACSGWPRSAGASWRRWSGTSISRSATRTTTGSELESLGFAPTGVLPHRRRPRRGSPSAPPRPALETTASTTAWSTSCSSAGSRRTRRSRITSGWPSTTSATSTRTTASSSSARPTRVPRYYQTIRALMRRVPTCRTDRFLFTGPVPDEDLAAYYRHADVYISLSEHEGFCVPLLEAMAADVPVLAYGAAAVPETLGGAGVVVRPEGSRVRRRAARRARLRRRRPARASSPASASASPTSATTASRRELGRCSLEFACMKIAFIVQRYGAEILGGSEYHCRLIAERLADAPPRRGADHLRPRLHHLEERVSGGHRPRPRRHRAPLRHARRRATSRRSTATRTGSSTTRTPTPTSMEWLEQQGPWRPALLEYLQRHHRAYDALIFFTYLYAPTVLGLQIDPHAASWCRRRTTSRRSICGIYRELFEAPSAFAYNTDVERALPERAPSTSAPRPKKTVGCGVDLPQATAREPGRRRRAEAAAAATTTRRRTSGYGNAAACAARGEAFRRRHRLHGPVAALRRPHRSGQGLRGAAAVLHTATRDGRRRDAGADGRRS